MSGRSLLRSGLGRFCCETEVRVRFKVVSGRGPVMASKASHRGLVRVRVVSRPGWVGVKVVSRRC